MTDDVTTAVVFRLRFKGGRVTYRLRGTAEDRLEFALQLIHVLFAKSFDVAGIAELCGVDVAALIARMRRSSLVAVPAPEGTQ